MNYTFFLIPTQSTFSKVITFDFVHSVIFLLFGIIFDERFGSNYTTFIMKLLLTVQFELKNLVGYIMSS